ncbi:hypothetical protein Pflav_068750 [Phytohabitans flavus]|uniref:Uncharacterized protein n=1 Tax=Phytohabitans flavus TaxID=1076124 RepID=A0A6F8Y2Z9_9ACTN|nr:hypothetical protein Pflav_068750 [Phytohabitans flavus]
MYRRGRLDLRGCASQVPDARWEVVVAVDPPLRLGWRREDGRGRGCRLPIGRRQRDDRLLRRLRVALGATECG